MTEKDFNYVKALEDFSNVFASGAEVTGQYEQNADMFGAILAFVVIISILLVAYWFVRFYVPSRLKRH